MASLSIRDFLIIKKKVIEIVPTTAIKCSTTDVGTLLAHKIFRYMKWIEKEVHRRAIPHSFSYNDFLSNLATHCGIPEQSLNKNAIITYESDVIKLCFMHKLWFSLIIKRKDEE